MMTEDKMITKTVTMNPKMIERIDELRWKKRNSFSEYVRGAIKDKLKTDEKENVTNE